MKKVENIIEAGKLVKPTIGWLMIFFFTTDVVVIFNLKIKKIYSNSYD